MTGDKFEEAKREVLAEENKLGGEEEKTLSFQEWFDIYGDQLLRGWLRAREDGSDEDYKDWVQAEYDYYLDPPYHDAEGNLTDDEDAGEPEPYEVPYFGILDQTSKAEKFLKEHIGW